MKATRTRTVTLDIDALVEVIKKYGRMRYQQGRFATSTDRVARDNSFEYACRADALLEEIAQRLER